MARPSWYVRFGGKSGNLDMAVVLIVASYLSILYFDRARNLQPVQSVEFPLVASARVLD